MTTMARSLRLDPADRAALWGHVVEAVEAYARDLDTLRVAPRLDPAAFRARLASLQFDTPMDPGEAVDLVVGFLRHDQVHTPHPRYFGLFNPAPTTMGIAADTLVAAFNPQMAAWSHSPFAAECERHLVRTLGSRFGWPAARVDGTFTSGGAEANHTAVLCALTHAFPEFAGEGLRALGGQPTLYVSGQAHDSLLKAARLCGLGTAAAREVPVDEGLCLRPDLLAEAVARDRRDGARPFLAVGTAGTTGAGAIDPLAATAEVCAREGLWFHVDAAWGGAAALVPELAGQLAGVDRADSITFDAHKWLSVPMAAGVFLTRHPAILERTFRVSAPYMPKEAEGLDVHDPFAHSMQWSRRFTGLKVFLSLAVAGFEGYAEAIRGMTRRGDELRGALGRAGFKVVNRTPLPLVCFVDGGDPRGERSSALVRAVIESGRAWVSTVALPRCTAVRACITNYATTTADVEALVQAMVDARGGGA